MAVNEPVIPLRLTNLQAACGVSIIAILEDGVCGLACRLARFQDRRLELVECGCSAELTRKEVYVGVCERTCRSACLILHGTGYDTLTSGESASSSNEKESGHDSHMSGRRMINNEKRSTAYS